MADEYYTPDNEQVKNTQTDFQSTAQQAQNVPPQQTQQAQNIPPDQRQNHGAQPGGNIPPNANFMRSSLTAMFRRKTDILCRRITGMCRRSIIRLIHPIIHPTRR